jgi:hypothetical protein
MTADVHGSVDQCWNEVDTQWLLLATGKENNSRKYGSPNKVDQSIRRYKCYRFEASER